MRVLELVVVLVTLAGTGWLGFALLSARREQAAVAYRLGSVAAIAAENERMATAARNALRSVDTTVAAVDLTNTVVRTAHETIAAIPFTVLESIPQTRETTKIVREVHDLAAGTVYDAIGGVNKRLGGFLSGRIAPATPAKQANAPRTSEPGTGALPKPQPAVDDPQR